MKLKECLELGKECGLTTWEDCYVNVDLHAMCIFKYDEINKRKEGGGRDRGDTIPDDCWDTLKGRQGDPTKGGWVVNEQCQS